MKKIFGILVVLMMVAGTFVSCSMPTNDSTGTIVDAGAGKSADFECTDGALKIVKDDYGDLHLCTKNLNVTPANGSKILCGGLKSYLPEISDNYIYATYEEFQQSSATFNDGMLIITSSVLTPSNGVQVIKIKSTNSTLKYKIIAY